MIISEVIDAIDIIDSTIMESEINTCLAISKSYDKMLFIEEYYNGEFINEFSIFQEGKIMDDVKQQGKGMSTSKKIISFIPRLVRALFRALKSNLTKIYNKCLTMKRGVPQKSSPDGKKSRMMLFAKLGITGVVAASNIALASRHRDEKDELKVEIARLKNENDDYNESIEKLSKELSKFEDVYEKQQDKINYLSNELSNSRKSSLEAFDKLIDVRNKLSTNETMLNKLIVEIKEHRDLTPDEKILYDKAQEIIKFKEQMMEDARNYRIDSTWIHDNKLSEDELAERHKRQFIGKQNIFSYNKDTDEIEINCVDLTVINYLIETVYHIMDIMNTEISIIINSSAESNDNIKIDKVNIDKNLKEVSKKQVKTFSEFTKDLDILIGNSDKYSKALDTLNKTIDSVKKLDVDLNNKFPKQMKLINSQYDIIKEISNYINSNIKDLSHVVVVYNEIYKLSEDLSLSFKNPDKTLNTSRATEQLIEDYEKFKDDIDYDCELTIKFRTRYKTTEEYRRNVNNRFKSVIQKIDKNIDGNKFSSKESINKFANIKKYAEKKYTEILNKYCGGGKLDNLSK